MTLIKSDIKIYGQHGKILRILQENGIFDSFAEGFVEAVLIGIYHGKKSEPDGSKGNEVSISRVYFSKRNDLEIILFTYIQLEKVYQEKELSAQKVFMYEEEDEEAESLIIDLIEYALYGIEKLGEKFADFLTGVPKEYIIDEIIDERFLNEESLVEKAKNDEKNLFYKSYDDGKFTNGEISEIVEWSQKDELI